ncbi:MAG: hypothetical protein ABI321_24845 [Polyangia bacterium]
MDLRRAFFSRSMKLLRHPTVVRWLEDPRAMDTFVVVAHTLGTTKERVQQTAADMRTFVRRLARR